MKRSLVALAVAVAAVVSVAGLGGRSADAQVPGPVANTGGPYTAVVGQVITLNGGASTGVGLTQAGFVWRFQDGTVLTGSAPQRAFAYAGTFPFTLTVSDGAGFSSTASGSVTVSGAVSTAPFGTGQVCGYVGFTYVCSAAVSVNMVYPYYPYYPFGTTILPLQPIVVGNPGLPICGDVRLPAGFRCR